MSDKKQYSDEFKREAIRLQETSGKSIAAVERELGLSHNLLRQWKKRFQVNAETNNLELSEVEQLKLELRQVRRELEIVQQERDILERRAAMKYEAIVQNRDEFPISRQCQVLGVSESGYYAWVKRPSSRREQENRIHKEQIHGLWQQYRGIYGAPRIYAELRSQGVCIGRHRVARLMREMSIQGKMPRKPVCNSVYFDVIIRHY